MKSFRVTFRCNPYRAQSHFLWINAPDNMTEKEIEQAAYQSNWRLPVDIIDEVIKWPNYNNTPDLVLPNKEQEAQASVAIVDDSSTSPDPISDLKKIRNYFGEHDKSAFEHWAYTFLDELENKLKEKEDEIRELKRTIEVYSFEENPELIRDELVKQLNIKCDEAQEDQNKIIQLQSSLDKYKALAEAIPSKLNLLVLSYGGIKDEPILNELVLKVDELCNRIFDEVREIENTNKPLPQPPTK